MVIKIELNQFTPKERAAYTRYISELEKFEENPNQSVGIYVEQFAENIPGKLP